MLKEIDERTERYLETLEQADAEASAQSLGGTGEPEQARVARLREQIAKLEQQRREHAEILTRLAAEPGTQLSLTDPDSRSLQKGHERVVGYNAQIGSPMPGLPFPHRRLGRGCGAAFDRGAGSHAGTK